MFGFMEESSDHESYIQSLDILLPVLLKVAVAPSWSRSWILGTAVLNSEVRKALKALDHIYSAAKSSVAGRKEVLEASSQKEDRSDMLQKLLEIRKTKGADVDFGIMEIEAESYVALCV